MSFEKKTYVYKIVQGNKTALGIFDILEKMYTENLTYR